MGADAAVVQTKWEGAGAYSHLHLPSREPGVMGMHVHTHERLAFLSRKTTLAKECQITCRLLGAPAKQPMVSPLENSLFWGLCS